MNPSTAHVEEQLLELAYGELPEADARAVNAHLEACPQCRARLEEIQGVRRVMAKLPGTSAPEAGLESLLAYAEQAARRTRAGPPPKPAWWRRWVFPLAGAAAAVVVVFVAREASRTRDLAQAVQAKAQEVAEAKVALPAAPAPAAAPELEAAFRPAGAPPPPVLAQKEEAPKRKKAAALDRAAEKAGEREDRSRDEVARGYIGGAAATGSTRGDELLGGLGVRGPAATRAGGGATVKSAPSPEPRAQVQAHAAAQADPAPAAAPAPAGVASAGAVPAAPERPARRAVVFNSLEMEEEAPPAPAAAESTSEEGRAGAIAPDTRARQLIASARAARTQQRYTAAAELLQTVLALKLQDSRLRMEALSISCDVQYALGNSGEAEALCRQLASEFPGTGAAQVATRRIAQERARLVGPSPTGGTQAAGAKASAPSTPAEAPATTAPAQPPR